MTDMSILARNNLTNGYSKRACTMVNSGVTGLYASLCGAVKKKVTKKYI